MSDDAPDTPPPAHAPRTAAVLRRIGLLLAALVLMWVMFGQIGARLILPHRQAPLAPPAPSPSLAGQPSSQNDSLAALGQRVSQLETKINTLEHAQQQPADLSALNARLDALQARLDAHPSADSDAALQAVTARLTAMEERSNHQLAAMAVFEPLKAAVIHGAPFQPELAQLTQIMQGDSKVQALLKELAPYAGPGAPTLGQLHSQFETLVPRALASAPGNGPLMRNLESLIRIRKVGEQQQGNDDQAVIARAEAKLNRGDVDAGSKALAGLSPDAAQVFAPWLEQARQWLHIRQTLGALQTALLTPAPLPLPPPAEPVKPPPVPPAALSPAPAPNPSGIHSL